MLLETLRRRYRVCVTASVGVAALIACTSDDPAGPASPGASAEDAGGTTPPSGTLFGDADTTPVEEPRCVNMDFLFVIDNSKTMGARQDQLAANAGPLFAKLDAFAQTCGDQFDYRVAFTTSDRSMTWTMTVPPEFPPFDPFTSVGDDGRFRQVCAMTRPWIQRTDADREANFACAIKVGITGSDIEMPFESMELALTARVADGGPNAGFLRPDALLAIVVVTDEDDCSRKDDNFVLGLSGDCSVPPGEDAGAGWLGPATYVAALDAIKGRRELWTFAGIAGDRYCQDPEDEMKSANEAYRVKEFVQLAGDNAVFGSICEEDLTPALDAALQKFAVVRQKLVK